MGCGLQVRITTVEEFYYSLRGHSLMQIVCRQCSKEFTIPKQRGRPPHRCPECRQAGPQIKLDGSVAQDTPRINPGEDGGRLQPPHHPHQDYFEEYFNTLRDKLREE